VKLAPLRTRHKALPDLLNYATVIAPGVVLCKDGSLLSGFYYRGPDTDSQTIDERNAAAATLNRKFTDVDSGWTIHIDALRIAASGYPDRSRLHFPDTITRLIDEGRRSQYTRDHAHYETVYATTVSYLPPLLVQSKIDAYMYQVDEETQKSSIADKTLREFQHVVQELRESLGDIVAVEPMTGYETQQHDGRTLHRDALVDYLNWCISGEDHPVNLSAHMPFLDGLIGNHVFVGGVAPIIDDRHICVIGFAGFPLETSPGMLAILDALPLEYRWSNRYIYMDAEDARTELDKYRRQWRQKERGFLDQVFKTSRSAVDRDAMRMVDETEAAIADANSQNVKFGYYTGNLILTADDKTELHDIARDVRRQVQNLGFTARIETVNAVEAWLGSLPGHSFYNIRRPILHTMNLTDILPLSAVWAGRDVNPCDKYPAYSPALLYTDTIGATTFRLNLHVNDVGHTLIFGPTGSGKSTLLALIAAQFMKYARATFWGFDKGFSLYCLTKAMNRPHFDIAGEGSTLAFCPLVRLESESDIAWAEDWIRSCAELQLDRQITPVEKAEIHSAMRLHAETQSRTLTEYVSNIQNETLREALTHYTLLGAMGMLLDADDDGLEEDDFTVFELASLMNLSDADKLPVLLYLFHRIEKQLRGQPAMIMMDEAWVMLGHPVFRAKIREWLKELRKQNCVVVMATQSLSDAANSGIVDVLVESCPTKIFLPNPTAKADLSRGFYERIGLNEAQIDIISTAVQKRQYYVMSEEGNRLFELALSDLALAFVAQSGSDARKSVNEYINRYGDTWPFEWLNDRGVDYKRYLRDTE